MKHSEEKEKRGKSWTDWRRACQMALSIPRDDRTLLVPTNAVTEVPSTSEAGCASEKVG